MIGGHDARLGAGHDPLLEQRITIVAFLMLFAFGVFGVRLFQLQVLEGADLFSRSEQNFVRTQRLEAPRGDIVDREGRLLAATRPAFGVKVIPAEIREPEALYRTLASMLDEEAALLRERVGTPRGRARFAPVILEGDLDEEERARLETHRFALPGVVTDMTPRRLYVEGSRAAHLLGSIGEITKRQLAQASYGDYKAGEIVGQRGLEARQEPHLRGRAGGRNLVVDVAGRERELLDEVEPVPGGRLVLSLDLDLQRVAEEAFRAPPPKPPASPDEPAPPPERDKMGALVALDPRNGDVLALVSRPAYDPNAFAGGIDAGTWQGLLEDPWTPLQDRALSGEYAPGSTYKALVALAGLAEDKIDPEATVFCPGFFRLGRRTYRCWKRVGHGDVNFKDSLVHSCDVYYYKLGLELGVDTLAKMARAFGLGRPTGVDLAGEKPGLVPTRAWKERRFKEPWIRGETLSAAIGQGFNLTTPLQLAVAYAAIANGGRLVKPRVVLRQESWNGRALWESEPEDRERVDVVPEHLALVRDALEAVVMETGGTGGRARVRGIQVAGKTGTTQVVRLERVEDLEEDEIPIQFRDHAWFASFAPADAPEIVVVALVEHGGSGGSVAAPIAQRVLKRYFDKHPRAASDDVQAARHAPGGDRAWN
ncbi:MAG: penicillin-binding protein 2 [Proteobacteria bacterium]|nr:penicillin-binding protein 2 [Pseudomonadota bacterium]